MKSIYTKSKIKKLAKQKLPDRMFKECGALTPAQRHASFCEEILLLHKQIESLKKYKSLQKFVIESRERKNGLENALYVLRLHHGLEPFDKKIFSQKELKKLTKLSETQRIAVRSLIEKNFHHIEIMRNCIKRELATYSPFSESELDDFPCWKKDYELNKVIFDTCTKFIIESNLAK